ncbi:MAG TPA: LamG-like jellyroll fold domain-containing protein [Candidatus Saccharimonadales bacterium]|nr:LamG-like jellyroll fold domain-containing protein [Candidatus Saccharimonadales bacterium]
MRAKRTHLIKISQAAAGLLFVFCSTGLSSVEALSNNALAGYWALNESTQGATAADSSGNGNAAAPHGTSGGPAPSAAVPSAISFPDPYSSNFNGAQYLAAPDSSSLDNTNAMSVSAWVRFANVSGNQTIAAKWQVGVKQQWVLQLNGGHISFWTGDGGTGQDNLASATIIAANTWYNIVASDSNGNKNLFINGSLDTSDTSATSLGVAGGTPLTIGGKQNSSGTYFEFLDGNIDDVRVYNQALSFAGQQAIAAGIDIDPSAPTLTNKTENLYPNQQVITNVISGAGDNPDPLSLSIETAPIHGNASANTANGTITYQPDEGYVGADSLSYSICSPLFVLFCSTASINYSTSPGESVNSTATPHVPDTGYGGPSVNLDLPNTLLVLSGGLIVTGAILSKSARKP